MTTDKQPRFTAETDSYDGRKKLVLHLPPGSPQLGAPQKTENKAR